MLLENILPNLSQSTLGLFMVILGIVCTFFVVYGFFLETEKRQDIFFMIGFFGLFIYATFISNPIFILASLGLFFAATIELIEIIVGIHKHEKYDLKRIVREGRKKIKD